MLVFIFNLKSKPSRHITWTSKSFNASRCILQTCVAISVTLIEDGKKISSMEKNQQ